MSYNYASKHGSAVAQCMGYKEFPDENAYDDACYIKDALKWVFKITGLKKLSVYSDDDLFKQNYDVVTPIIALKRFPKRKRRNHHRINRHLSVKNGLDRCAP